MILTNSEGSLAVVCVNHTSFLAKCVFSFSKICILHSYHQPVSTMICGLRIDGSLFVDGSSHVNSFRVFIRVCYVQAVCGGSADGGS